MLNSLIKKYKDMSLQLKAGFWFTVCNFLQRGITMITTPIFTRLLLPEEYGLVSTFYSWQSILLLLTTLSLYKAMMNLYVKRDNKEEVVSAISGLSLVLTLIWLLIYLIFRKEISSLLQMSEALCTCLFVSFVFQAVLNIWLLYKRYTFEYKQTIFVTLLITILSSIASVICVVAISPTAESRLIPSVAVTGIIGLVLYILIFRKNKCFYKKEIWVFALGFCLPLLPHYLSEFVLQSSDKLMINYMCGKSDVAMYSIAYSAGSLITLITSAINTAFAPYQYQQIKSKNYESLAKAANNVLIFVAVMLAMIMLFSKEIVLIFGGEQYLESVEVIIPICVGVYFNYVFQLFARVQEYYEHKLMIVLPSIICAVLNLITNYIFIQMYGYQAAAYTTVGCYLLFCIVHYIFYLRVVKNELKGEHIYKGKTIAIISAGVILSGIIITFINQVPILKYSLIVIMCIIVIIKRKKIIEIAKNIFK